MSSTQGEVFSDNEASPFRMISIFDSAEAQRQATHASEVILRELGEDIMVNKSAWELQSFDSASDREEAAAEAARADVIVIAISDETPSAAFKKWAAQWQQKRELSSGLLALIPAGNSESGGDLADFLYEMAVTAKMDFLCRKKRRFDADN